MPKDDHVLKYLEKIDNKIDRLDNRLDGVEKIQVKQEANLGEHMRRTDLAEESIQLLREDLKPVQTHVSYMNGFLKGIGILATLAGIGAAALEIVKFFQ